MIGGGIVGICSALALQADGHAVEIIEKDRVGGGSSFGNCGLLAVGEVVPISRPGTLLCAPRWLVDPEGPLFVRPAALIREIGWLARFLMAGRPSRVREIARAMAALTRTAEDDYCALLERSGLADNLVRTESIMVFDSAAAIDHEASAWRLRRELGFDHEILSRDDLRRLEPGLGGPLAAGVLLRNWLRFSDPHLMARRLAADFESRGGRIRQGRVISIPHRSGDARSLVLASGEVLSADWIVLAAGAWSGALSRQLGARTPLTALQGYHYHVPAPRVELTHAILYSKGGFVLTPMETGLRIAGTLEIAGLDPEPDYRRAEVIARRARRILPDLDLSGGTMWMGPRPFMPDTKPVIGMSPRHSNVVLAYGHGQLGLTLAPTTGRIVADLVAGRRVQIDLHPYSPARF